MIFSKRKFTIEIKCSNRKIIFVKLSYIQFQIYRFNCSDALLVTYYPVFTAVKVFYFSYISHQHLNEYCSVYLYLPEEATMNTRMIAVIPDIFVL